MTGVLSIVEGELVELLKLVLVQDLLVQTEREVPLMSRLFVSPAQLLFELVHGVTAQLAHPAHELLPAELALGLGLELPGDDQHRPGGGVLGQGAHRGDRFVSFVK